MTPSNTIRAFQEEVEEMRLVYVTHLHDEQESVAYNAWRAAIDRLEAQMKREEKQGKAGVDSPANSRHRKGT